MLFLEGILESEMSHFISWLGFNIVVFNSIDDTK